MMDKATLRAHILAERKQLSADDQRRASLAICHQVLRVLQNKPFSTVLLYSTIRNEVDCSLIAQHLHREGKQLFLPRIDGNNMVPASYVPNQPLVPGSFAILEPTDSTPPPPMDIVLVPCVACDKDKNRLGYGKGFYDRFLANNPYILLRIGLCYDFQIVDHIPTAPHDIPLDAIISDKRILC